MKEMWIRFMESLNQRMVKDHSEYQRSRFKPDIMAVCRSFSERISSDHIYALCNCTIILKNSFIILL
jgi:hypothetical protein